jgi:hypothetical protein
MMNAGIFEQFADAAVAEPVTASTEPPSMLHQSEQALYRRLLDERRGRLEQEFLPDDLIRSTILKWASDS